MTTKNEHKAQNLKTLLCKSKTCYEHEKDLKVSHSEKLLNTALKLSFQRQWVKFGNFSHSFICVVKKHLELATNK